MYLHKYLLINNLFPLVLDPRLPSSVCFNVMFISLEISSAGSDEDQELYSTPVECMEIKAEVKAMKYKQVIILCQIIFSSTLKIYDF